MVVVFHDFHDVMFDVCIRRDVVLDIVQPIKFKVMVTTMSYQKVNVLTRSSQKGLALVDFEMKSPPHVFSDAVLPRLALHSYFRKRSSSYWRSSTTCFVQ